jgi:FtsP/CotA-like multicopper oxidase with cupredoxin domain
MIQRGGINMKNTIAKRAVGLFLAAAVMLFGGTGAHAAIQGLTGTNFALTATSGYISTADGGSYLMWGYANGAGLMQYPGPTLIVNQGDAVTVNLTNSLAVPVSIVFPGQTGVTATGGSPGLLTNEAAASGGTVSYTFTASQPGTYTYYSGTQPELQIEMGLVGSIIVRPTGYTPGNGGFAYLPNDGSSTYDHEYLFFLTEMDPVIHDQVAAGTLALVDTTKRFATYWMINGRTATDTLAPANAAWLPHQPYNCVPMMHPAEKILLRMIGGGADLHPYHTHGNHHLLIARDGKLISSTPGGGPDLATFAYTHLVVPGQTADAIFTWNAAKLGWDIYGHTAEDAPLAGEYLADHGKAIPVTIPSQEQLTRGPWYSGSPFLGGLGASLPPGEGGFNPNGAFTYMWHSHSEKELTNNDIFPGGMLTMMYIEAPGVTLANP